MMYASCGSYFLLTWTPSAPAAKRWDGAPAEGAFHPPSVPQVTARGTPWNGNTASRFVKHHTATPDTKTQNAEFIKIIGGVGRFRQLLHITVNSSKTVSNHSFVWLSVTACIYNARGWDDNSVTVCKLTITLVCYQTLVEHSLQRQPKLRPQSTQITWHVFLHSRNKLVEINF